MKKRIIAFAVDYAIIEGLETLILLCATGNQVSEKNMTISLIVVLALELLYLFKDAVGGQSIGKRMVGVKVVSKDGEDADALKLIARNITLFIWPIEAILLICRKERLGDRLAKTKVVEV